MTSAYTDTNGRRVTPRLQLPGFRGLCLFAATWAAAAAGSRLSRPPALRETPAGHPGGDDPNMASMVHNLFTYVPEEAGLVLGAALLGWAIAAGLDECDTLGARRHRRAAGTMALTVPLAWLLGCGPAVAGLAVATTLLWPTCRHPERATPQLVLVCATAAAAGPLFAIGEHHGALLDQARQFGTDAGDLTGWVSGAWQTAQPWAAEAQREQSTGSWSGWWSLQTTLGLTKTSTYSVYTAAMLACAGLLLGLRAGVRRTPSYEEALKTVVREKILIAATLGAGTAALLLQILNDWEGLGPRLATVLSAVTALAAGRLVFETPGLPDARRRIEAEMNAAGADRPREAPDTLDTDPGSAAGDPSRQPLTHLAGALAAYIAGAAAVHAVPWTSPTPIGQDFYGRLDGAGALAGAAIAATAAAGAFCALEKMRDVARQGVAAGGSAPESCSG